MKRIVLIKLIEDTYLEYFESISFQGEDIIGEGNGYFFTKKNNWGEMEFNFRIICYENSHKVILNGGYVSFYAVEGFLKKYYPKYGKYLSSNSTITLYNSFYNLSDTSDIILYSESDFIKLIPLWTRNIKENILPFFDQWGDLKKINEFINTVKDWKTLYQFIPGEAGFKKMIIMKLCNNPNYEIFIKEWGSALKEETTSSKDDKAYYDLFCELKEELESIEPLYT